MATLNLGIDFGTSFTKVCVRNIAQRKSRLVGFGNSKKNTLDTALLLTKISIQKDGKLIAALTESEWNQQSEKNAINIDFIKMRLANIDLSQEEQKERFKIFEPLPKYENINLNTQVNIENLAIYYLACVIKRVSEIEKSGKNEIRSINVGIPVQYQDSKVAIRFEKVLSLAWKLSEIIPSPMTLLEVQKHLTELRSQTEEFSNIQSIPEVRAAVYASSQRIEGGLLVYFDIGSGTIDVAALEIKDTTRNDPQNCLFASVFPIGVSALAQRVAKRSPVTFDTVVRELENNNESILQDIEKYCLPLVKLPHVTGNKSEFIANKFKITKETIEEKSKNGKLPLVLSYILGQQTISQLTGFATMACRTKKPDVLKSQSFLRILIGGGGKDIQYYEDTIMGTHSAFQQSKKSIPEYIKYTRGLATPNDLDMSGLNDSNFHRFSIAYGLSIPKEQLPDLVLPRLIPEKQEAKFEELPLMDDW
ncbi:MULTISPECIES: hypothetical protein [Spirulina sp. CCY15215]|uniref:hypothetical protein n=1 Tax=Spirulina sp. CCY15215 TaxID=2767591 RepID=UPI00195206F3|nr:hypothetical protein [Spirulina major]